MKDGFIEAFEDATGVDASASTDEIRDSSGKYYHSAIPAPTGGTITTYGSYTVHSFLNTGNTNFVVNKAGNVDVLVVAGGGAGGGSSGPGDGNGGGGGAGGFRTATSHAVTAQTYTVTVGAGGVSGSPGGTNMQGGDSIFSTITSAGGGAGGGVAFPGPPSGVAGGSGGGGEGWYTTTYSGGAGNTPSTSPSQGNSGGSNTGSSGPSYSQGGGGGGSGGAGANGSVASGASSTFAAGGVGTANDFRTGSNVTYAAGGRGAGHQWTGSVAATSNTGDGGDGNGTRDGASGIVVIKYTTDSLSAFNNVTLVSNAQTAQAQADTARITVFEHPSTGTTTVNTDIKAYASRDNGTTYTQITLADDGEYESGKKLLSGSADISGQPAGTSMRYKIETLNQSSSKITRLHGVSLQWA
jgi:hypothetical protein